ncbi:MAG: hypothetical protein TREMPRED_001249 [Tremellales sp. Tagirdzhanova-0007]|nr:MAG: hypothetical protein TREMPRED_001249 [Tremellales sp. Tagirdzhanova-0007]
MTLRWLDHRHPHMRSPASPFNRQYANAPSVSPVPTPIPHSSLASSNLSSSSKLTRASTELDGGADRGPELEPDFEPEPTSAYAKFKLLTKRYGWWALGMYLVLSLIDFSLVLVAVHTLGADRFESLASSILHQYRNARHGPDQTAQLEAEDERKKIERERKLSEEETSMTTEERKRHRSGGFGSRTMWAEIALAYAIHKTALLPFRAGLTVAWTPRLVGWLGERGWVGKGGITRAATHAQGKIRSASDRVRDVAKTRREGPT